MTAYPLCGVVAPWSVARAGRAWAVGVPMLVLMAVEARRRRERL